MAITQTETEDALKAVVQVDTGTLTVAHDSLAYRTAEIETHMHSRGSWFGMAITPTATHLADRIGPLVQPFQLDAGNEDWGAWVQVLGSDDTPARDTNAY